MRMFDRKRNFIFVHIPKTGGTSVGSALRNGNKPEKIEGYHAHMPVSHLIEHVIPDFDSYFSFAFVRNPYERLYSGYSSVMQKHPETFDNENPSFKEWLLDEKWHQKTTTPVQRELDVLKSFPPAQKKNYGFWIDHEGFTRVQFIGKMENIVEDFEIIRKRIGGPIPRLKHLNRSRHGHYRDAYDNEMIDFMEEHHKKDLIRFGYEF